MFTEKNLLTKKYKQNKHDLLFPTDYKSIELQIYVNKVHNLMICMITKLLCGIRIFIPPQAILLTKNMLSTTRGCKLQSKLWTLDRIYYKGGPMHESPTMWGLGRVVSGEVISRFEPITLGSQGSNLTIASRSQGHKDILYYTQKGYKKHTPVKRSLRQTEQGRLRVTRPYAYKVRHNITICVIQCFLPHLLNFHVFF